MKLLKRRVPAPASASTPASGSAPASASTPVPEAPAEPDFPGSDDELRAAIAQLAQACRDRPDPAQQRRLLWLRHLAGIRVLDQSSGRTPSHPDPDPAGLPDFNGELPGVGARELTPGLLRAGILRDGCLLVRGLVDRETARGFAEEIQRAFVERERFDEGLAPAPGYYEEFVPDARFDPYLGRPWIKMGGGVYAADSPRLSVQMNEVFTAAAIPELVSAYLGEPALISVHKSTLRKADPSVPGAWHQDGAFMGPVRALNLWLSVSRCGDESPGLDIVPRRLEEFVATRTEEATLDMQVSQRKAVQAAGERGVRRPIFGPGDALFFDELFLHQTGSDPAMPKPRYALESWFFGASGFPSAYAPIAV